MRLGLAFDLQTDPTDARQAEFDSPRVLETIQAALASLGHEVVPLGSAHDLLREPKRLSGVELVFNLAEGLHGRCREAWVPNLLELSGVPYVGSDSLTLMLGLDKVLSKQLALASGVPTPAWLSAPTPEALPPRLPLKFPVIVKPRWEGSGRGIDRGAVVHDHTSLQARARWLAERCPGPLLIEEFIPGGEVTVFLIGNEPSVASWAVQRPLDAVSGLSYHVSGAGDQAAWTTPLTLDDHLDQWVRQAALTVFQALGCRDMARVDFRVGPGNAPQFLEINPLPSFDPEGTLGLLAEHLGTSYAELIGRILDAAVTRVRGTACGTGCCAK